MFVIPVSDNDTLASLRDILIADATRANSTKRVSMFISAAKSSLLRQIDPECRFSVQIVFLLQRDCQKSMRRTATVFVFRIVGSLCSRCILPNVCEHCQPQATCSRTHLPLALHTLTQVVSVYGATELEADETVVSECIECLCRSVLLANCVFECESAVKLMADSFIRDTATKVDTKLREVCS